ncbi:lipopolysaccharide biosynthesis protein [Oleiharenicola sp. Vm1]|uniref:lipopolysaccharide biosynthesis protein n=1 Tax=Oleiharenicola sp. Vm1 TaxID=3398393 RepID=UPI0039F53498
MNAAPSFRLRALLERILPRGMAQLAGAGFASQVISLAAVPLVARQAGPDALGLLQGYLTVTTFAAVVACLRFEYALLQPAEEATAVRLVVLACLAAAATGVLTAAGLGVLAAVFDTPAWHALAHLRWTVGGVIAISGASLTFTQWMIRHGQFDGIARARWIQSFCSAGAQLTAAYAGWGGVGLVLGEAASRLVGALVLYAASGLARAPARSDLSAGALAHTLREYRRFPLVSGSSSLVNALGFSLPAFIIERYFGLAALGTYSVVERVAGLPTTLIGTPLSQTFAHRLRQALADSPRATTEALNGTLRLACWLGFPAFAALALAGPQLFAFAFGEGWHDAGRLARLLAVPYGIAYAVWPVMVTLTIVNRLRLQLLWDLTRTGAMLGVLALAAHGYLGFDAVFSAIVWLIAAFGVLHYRLCLKYCRP